MTPSESTVAFRLPSPPIAYPSLPRPSNRRLSNAINHRRSDASLTTNGKSPHNPLHAVRSVVHTHTHTRFDRLSPLSRTRRRRFPDGELSNGQTSRRVHHGRVSNSLTSCASLAFTRMEMKTSATTTVKPLTGIHGGLYRARTAAIIE